MVDVSKLKAENRLGTPPDAEAVKGNLRQAEEGQAFIADGRSLRATGRTAQLATGSSLSHSNSFVS